MKGELERAALDGRGVQHVVDQPGDLLRADLDDRSQLALLIGSGAGGQQTGGSNHCIELVPHLVTEVRQQLGVQHARLGNAVGVCAFFHRLRLLLAHQLSCSAGG